MAEHAMVGAEKGFKSLSELGLRGRKLARHTSIGKAHAVMAAIAKGLFGGLAATAKRNHGPARQPKSLAGRVVYFEFPFDAQGTVMEGSYLSSHRPDGSTREVMLRQASRYEAT
jgi:hypothetical protein